MRAARSLIGLGAVLLLLAAVPAIAIGVDPPLPDAAAEARAHEISRSLRCLVCQNQSIEDSNAPLARDLRMLVRERILAGDDDAAIRQFVVARYGDWVLLSPPFNVRTYALWIGPFVLLAVAVAGTAVYLRRQRSQVTAAEPLSEAERQRLDALLGDGRQS